MMRAQPLDERRRRVHGRVHGALLLLVAAVLFLAYRYQPPEARDETSRYLRQVQTHYLDTTGFRRHYLQAGA
jgi:hypothetical protein